jgi:uncharacterized membrane protein affecting hemolysin expression
MAEPQMVMYEEEFRQIQAIVDALVQAANASVAFIIDKNGQLIAAGGDAAHIDTTSLASLTAGNIAATGGMRTNSIPSFTKGKTRTSTFSSWTTG